MVGMVVEMIKTYSELSKLKTFKERFEYLKLDGIVGKDTFGYDRYLNQLFYKSKEWKRLRDKIIVRDNGCDLGVAGYDIPRGAKVIIHHLNPITSYDLIDETDYLMNPEYLICTTLKTHNAIHYGDKNLLPIFDPVERTKNDTCPWRHD